MFDIAPSVFFNFFIFLFIPFVLAAAFKKNKISPLVGYMLGGIILSNFLTNLTSQEVINNFAYFGIVLLLFTIGLEINFEKILTVKKFIVLGGLLQLILSTIFIFLASRIFGFSLIQSFLIGLALSSSSTTVVAKLIQDRGEENSFHGELAIGILMFQDLAFIPYVIIFNSLTTNNLSFFDVFTKIIIDMTYASIILVLIYVLGRKLIPMVFDRVARLSRELLNLFIILFIFFICFASLLIKVPVLISVFIAGILIGQTMEHYHIFSQMRPLRDVLAIIFFIFIGATVRLDIIFPLIPKIIAFGLFISLIKAIIILTIFLFFRMSSKLAFYLSLFLFQVDEDAFILMSLAFANKIFNQEQYVFIISSVIFSLMLTPFLINNKENIYLKIRGFIKKFFPGFDSLIKHKVDFDRSPIDILNIKDHVVICGYGRIGSYVGRALMLADIPFIAIDYNFHIVEKARRQGANIIYGDPTDVDILDYAETDKALAIVIALPSRFSQEAIIINAKKLNSKIIIIGRIHHSRDQKRIKDLGADIVIQPEFEASISIIKKIFLLKNISREEVIKKLRYLKAETEGI